MPIKDVEGFLSLVPTALHTSNSPANMVGIPNRVYGASNDIWPGQAATSGTSVTRNGDWLKIKSNAQAGAPSEGLMVCAVSRSLSEVYTFAANTFAFGGVRMKSEMSVGSLGGVATGIPLVCFHDTRPANTPNSQFMHFPIFKPVDIPGGGVAGQEYYLEWAIEMSTQKVLRRVNGVRISDLPFSGSQDWYSAFLAQGVGISYGSTTAYIIANTTIIDMDVRDIYYGEKVSGESTDWLGARSLVAVGLADVSAPWTPSDGTDSLSVLMTEITNSATFLAPVATTDGTTAEGTIHMNAAIAGTIDFVKIDVVAKRTPTAAATLKSKVTLDSVDVDGTDRVLTTTMARYSALTLPKAPGNLAWTNARLAALTLKLSVG